VDLERPAPGNAGRLVPSTEHVVHLGVLENGVKGGAPADALRRDAHGRPAVVEAEA
jgi:hypothetical protein